MGRLIIRFVVNYKTLFLIVLQSSLQFKGTVFAENLTKNTQTLHKLISELIGGASLASVTTAIAQASKTELK